MARALFKSWFIDFDPIRAKSEGRQSFDMETETAGLFPSRLVPSALGDIPEGWTAGTLGDVADNSRTVVQPHQLSSETPYIGLEHMPRRSIALAEWGQADDVTSHKSAFVRGDFLFGKLRPYFHKVGIAAIDGIASTDIAVLRAKQKEYYAFTLSVISSNAFVDYTNQLSNGAKMPRINWADMAKYELVLPSPQIASAYNAIVAPMLSKIIASVHESKELSKLRDYLLPKLICGDIRIPDAEKFVEAA
jgi:type I restriction enzyme S subunit